MPLTTKEMKKGLEQAILKEAGLKYQANNVGR